MKTPYRHALVAWLMMVLAHQPVAAQTNPALYSGEAVTRLCLEAQKVIANTALDAIVVAHAAPVKATIDWSFTRSSPAPYEGPNLSAYNSKETTGDTLPLTVQAYARYNDGPGAWRYPETVSCKMKDAEGIQFHLGAMAAGAQAQCRDVNEQIVGEVFASLTSWQRRTLAYDENEIVFEDDILKASGPEWLNPLASPFAPNTIYLGTDGLLHVKSRASFVARTNPTMDAGPDKKGSYYCHLPSPEHVLNVIRGRVAPCSFDSDFCIR